MDKKEADQLHPGDEVYWNDPDDGVSSGHYTVLGRHGDILYLKNLDGSEVEVFAHELS